MVYILQYKLQWYRYCTYGTKLVIGWYRVTGWLGGRPAEAIGRRPQAAGPERDRTC